MADLPVAKLVRKQFYPHCESLQAWISPSVVLQVASKEQFNPLLHEREPQLQRLRPDMQNNAFGCPTARLRLVADTSAATPAAVALRDVGLRVPKTSQPILMTSPEIVSRFTRRERPLWDLSTAAELAAAWEGVPRDRVDSGSSSTEAGAAHALQVCHLIP